jgi:hypothetical protein
MELQCSWVSEKLFPGGFVLTPITPHSPLSPKCKAFLMAHFVLIWSRINSAGSHHGPPSHPGS